ncbi:PP2C family serine/threonine-protein phosphatase [Sphingomonas abietis]|uniref:PP2C family serine/threonine-protein phosphatase n=1 Tax=Sphingomonas abietis TaxID=3012344 RepID=A0ABY7NWM8_9SPHN|nr:PP2C family serine/threonine-protein phosphatase [Sphingomonas abietis]WBO24314.1 PP2C family serine/threonine-protein phosphatase [Sphingomonas abietis]
MASWAWAGASCRGVSHAKAGTRRQDAFSVFAVRDGSTLVAIVSDGAGSSSHGGEGASVICRTFTTSLRSHFATVAEMPTDDDLWGWLDTARDRIASSADRLALRLRDFAATVVITVTDGKDTLVAHVGDGSSVVRSSEAADWRVTSWPAQGQYAATTFFVTDEPEVRMRMVRSDHAIDAVVAFTDGIERLALDFASETPHVPFFAKIIVPLEQSGAVGSDRDLSEKLAAYLNSDAINARTDDDKTLVLAVLR